MESIWSRMISNSMGKTHFSSEKMQRPVGHWQEYWLYISWRQYRANSSSKCLFALPIWPLVVFILNRKFSSLDAYRGFSSTLEYDQIVMRGHAQRRCFWNLLSFTNWSVICEISFAGFVSSFTLPSKTTNKFSLMNCCWAAAISSHLTFSLWLVGELCVLNSFTW